MGAARYLMCWLILSYSCGVSLFLRGFLLTRREIHSKSSPSTTNRTDFLTTLEPKYKRVIILIIDALRYDFLSYDDHSPHVPVYKNNVPVVHRMMENQSSHAVLYQFIADPPTSTLQRLKGMMTGSLPTFVDVGSNFGSDELMEDNVIHQLVSSGRNITFMGDDTWMGLFPNSFGRAYPYPSFDVWDIDTVDNGVRRHLEREIADPNWNVLIAHCLGVDHTGHRYGPEHPVMRSKLKQMNTLIHKVIAKMDPTSLLLVIGDHGMTRSGDHGGDSPDEIQAGLFAYSPRLSIKLNNKSFIVNQVDLVPTLAVLLGVPIPYSNLGSVMLDLIYPEHLWINGGAASQEHSRAIALAYSSDALWLNVQQAWGYLVNYNTEARFPHEDFTLLTDQFEHIKTIFNRLTSTHNCSCVFQPSCCPGVDRLNEFIRLSQSFLGDAREMCRSIWARFDATCMFAGLSIFALTLVVHVCSLSTRVPTTHVQGGILCSLVSLFLPKWLIIVSFGLNVVPALGFLANAQLGPMNRFSAAHLAPVVLAALYTSNSYIVQEPYVVQYLVQSLIWLPWIIRPRAYELALRVALSLCTRLGLGYFRCREEQSPGCQGNSLHRSLTSLADSEWSIVARIFVALFSFVVLFLLLKRHFLVDRDIKLLAAVVWCHWGIQAAAVLLFSVDPLVFTVLPRLFYIVLVVSLARRIPLFFRTRMAIDRNGIIGLVCLLWMLASLLAGDGLAPGMSVTLANVIFVVLLSSKNGKLAELGPLYGLLSLQGFFATGHHTSLANVPWETAFVGFSHSSSPSMLANVLPVFLVSYSTGFSFLLHSISLPLALTTQLRARQESDEREKRLSYHLLFHGIRLFGCLGAAGFHCRHLMVWKIFAPRLLYELLFSTYTAIGLASSMFLVSRTV